MKKIRNMINSSLETMLYKERRRRHFEKNMITIKNYESLTKEELMIEYVDKRSEYEFQKRYLLVIVITTFLAIMVGGIKTVYLFLVSFLKNTVEVKSQIEEAIAIFNVLGIAIIVLFILAFILYIYLYLKDMKKLYKDLLIIEGVMIDRRFI